MINFQVCSSRVQLENKDTHIQSDKISNKEVIPLGGISRLFAFKETPFLPQVDSSVRAAFAMWASITDFSFSHKRSGSVHLEIRFVR